MKEYKVGDIFKFETGDDIIKIKITYISYYLRNFTWEWMPNYENEWHNGINFNTYWRLHDFLFDNKTKYFYGDLQSTDYIGANE